MKRLVLFCSLPSAAAGHPLAEDGPARSAFHRLSGGEESPSQLHKDRGERHDPSGDDPQGGACVFLGGFRLKGPGYLIAYSKEY